ACGTPVIAAALPGVRTLVEEGADGHLAAVGDEADLARLLELRLRGRDQAEAMGRKGREKVLREYDWGVIAGRLEQTYASVLREAKAR
ncbi:glycosyltransferase, partial [Escherichia coli]|nr:glycosyltransferase [Escherichia coli]